MENQRHKTPVVNNSARDCPNFRHTWLLHGPARKHRPQATLQAVGPRSRLDLETDDRLAPMLGPLEHQRPSWLTIDRQ